MTTDDDRYAISRIYHRGPWHVPYKATGVLCSDGRRRTARIPLNSDDTFFSLRASVQVKGHTITGFLSHHDDSTSQLDLRFTPDGWRKNAAMLPDW